MLSVSMWSEPDMIVISKRAFRACFELAIKRVAAMRNGAFISSHIGIRAVLQSDIHAAITFEK
jgi:hypothetical protein